MRKNVLALSIATAVVDMSRWCPMVRPTVGPTVGPTVRPTGVPPSVPWDNHGTPMGQTRDKFIDVELIGAGK